MTNIMGIEAETGNVFICADSQATVKDGKNVVQKLFVERGVLFTGTGVYDGILDLRKIATNMSGTVLQPKDVANVFLEEGKKLPLNRTDKRLSVYLAGVENNKPVLYDANISGKDDIDPYVSKISGIIFGGSGSSRVAPAAIRDFETRNARMYDDTESIAACFALGQIAEGDMYVDDRLQIGLVTKDTVRLLYHPSIPLGRETTLREYLNYFETNFGISRDQSKLVDEDWKGFSDVYGTLNDLYQGLLVSCGRMYSANLRVNGANTMSKVDFANRDKHEKERLEELKERDEEKGYVKELFDAWASGDITTIVNAVQSYHSRRAQKHSLAIQYVDSLKKKT